MKEIMIIKPDNIRKNKREDFMIFPVLLKAL